MARPRKNTVAPTTTSTSAAPAKPDVSAEDKKLEKLKKDLTKSIKTEIYSELADFFNKKVGKK